MRLFRAGDGRDPPPRAPRASCHLHSLRAIFPRHVSEILSPQDDRSILPFACTRAPCGESRVTAFSLCAPRHRPLPLPHSTSLPLMNRRLLAPLALLALWGCSGGDGGGGGGTGSRVAATVVPSV